STFDGNMTLHGAVDSTGPYIKLVANGPAYEIEHTNDGIIWQITPAGDGTLFFGNTTSGVGLILDVSNDVRVNGHFFPNADNTWDCGLSSRAWQNVVAHNYITVSTDADSAVADDGMVDVVKKVPVKTGTHLGIAKEDIASYSWAQADQGVNYNIV